MDRVFLDANVLFSAAYGSRGLGVLWKKANKAKCRLLASRYVVEEAIRNLRTGSQRMELKRLLTPVELVPEADPTLSCPFDLPAKDQPVFMAAASANAQFLLTGDRSHFGPFFGRTFMGVTIYTPAQYLAKSQGERVKRRNA